MTSLSMLEKRHAQNLALGSRGLLFSICVKTYKVTLVTDCFVITGLHRPDYLKTLKDKEVWRTSDRTNSCPLVNVAELQQLDRGSYDSAVDTKNELETVRWYDKKLITVFSGEHSIEPVEMCKRWSKHLGRQIEIPRPNLINMYNESIPNPFRQFCCSSSTKSFKPPEFTNFFPPPSG